MGEVEDWRDIPGWQGYYQASSLGRIRSMDRKVKIGRTNPLRRGKVLSPGFNDKGYKLVVLCREGKNRTRLLHRLVAQAFIENPLGLAEVDHVNLVKTDNRADNLCWVTRQENMVRAVKSGAFKPEKHRLVKLTRNQVDSIRYMSLLGFERAELCSIFGIKKNALRSIVLGLTWKDHGANLGLQEKQNAS